MEKTYEPHAIEQRWYQTWEEKGWFAPTAEGEGAYCIMIPPPNVTGSLHMGHGFNNAIMDTLIRYHRMSGDKTLVIKESLISSSISRNSTNLSAAHVPDKVTAAEQEPQTLTAVEKNHILKVLQQCHWTIAGKGGAAEKLDLPASTLRSKMKKLGIKRA